ncbi:MAG: hypothetical protein ACU85U_15615 [Gammaproteobacteria bacterium]
MFLVIDGAALDVASDTRAWTIAVTVVAGNSAGRYAAARRLQHSAASETALPRLRRPGEFYVRTRYRGTEPGAVVLIVEYLPSGGYE